MCVWCAIKSKIYSTILVKVEANLKAKHTNIENCGDINILIYFYIIALWCVKLGIIFAMSEAQQPQYMNTHIYTYIGIKNTPKIIS